MYADDDVSIVPKVFLWGEQRARAQSLVWLARELDAVYCDLVAIFGVARPLELPAATFVGYAQHAHHYPGALQALAAAPQATMGLEELLAAAQAAQVAPAAPRARPTADEAHDRSASRKMGMAHAHGPPVEGAEWDEHWLELARRNGIEVDQ